VSHFDVVVKRHYGECRYAECRGATICIES
jgi:hypothetical protein